MASKGHTVLLLGEGLFDLRKKLKSPRYWMKNNDWKPNCGLPIRLWLAVVADGRYTCWEPNGTGEDKYTPKVLMPDGTVVTDMNAIKRMVLEDKSTLLGPLFLLPGSWPESRDQRQPQSWQLVPANENNIEFVYITCPPTRRRQYNLQMCTKASLGFCPTEIDGSKMDCNPMSPDWDLETDSYPFLPYAILKPGDGRELRNISRSELYDPEDKHANDEEILLIMRTSCGKSWESQDHVVLHRHNTPQLAVSRVGLGGPDSGNLDSEP